ncbi:MAG: hypothetical protein J0L64_24580 [Acidobacteria bacterium]|nr:hypothetical protein [Acidobacteriota bacterium]
MKKLRAAVGRGSRNRFDDVRTVQYLLNCVPRRAGGPVRELRVDGVAGELTLSALERFLGQRGAEEERVTPRGEALRALSEFDPYPQLAMHSPPIGNEPWRKEHKAPRGNPAELAAASMGGVMGYAAAKQCRVGVAELVRVEGVATGAREAAAAVLAAEAEGDFPAAVRAAMAAARRAGEERARQWGLAVPAAGLDAAAALGLPAGETGAWLLLSRMADAARDGLERLRWFGAPGGEDALWRQWAAWWEMRGGKREG